MNFAGWQKTSLIDYPGSISTVLFTSGCNWKCIYCHNYQAITDPRNLVNEDKIKDFILERKNKIEAVVVSGGEPTLQTDLIDFLKWLKQTKLKIKLDTNGWNPEILGKILKLKLVDYVAMDIKTSFKKYYDITQVKIDEEKIKRSIFLLKNSDVDYEFRTTVFRNLVETEDLKEICGLVEGSKKYFLQNYVYQKSIKNGEKLKSYTEGELSALIDFLKCNYKIERIEKR